MNLYLIVGAVLFVLSMLGIVLRLHTLEKNLLTFLVRIESAVKDRDKRDNNLGQLKHEIDSLRSAIGNIAPDTESRIRRVLDQTRSREVPAPPRIPPRHYDVYEEPLSSEDGASQLLRIANQLVQQIPTTLDVVRERTSTLRARVSPWLIDGQPVAFIVEHAGTCYAVPNVVKPARLPAEWFNRSDFGFNDEIQRVVSLPRLTRRGNGYDVQQPGEFEK